MNEPIIIIDSDSDSDSDDSIKFISISKGKLAVNHKIISKTLF